MTWRDLMCGEVRPEHVGQAADALAGWADARRDHGGLVFVDLRDRAGICQLVVNPERAPDASRGRARDPQRVRPARRGEVVRRAPENVNPDLPTGEVELQVDELEIVSRSHAAAVPARRGGRRRDPAPALPLARPAPAADAAQHPRSGRGWSRRSGARWRRTASSTSRRRSSSSRRPRARATSSSRAASSRAASSRCRSRRRSSSSCS